MKNLCITHTKDKLGSTTHRNKGTTFQCLDSGGRYNTNFLYLNPLKRIIAFRLDLIRTKVLGFVFAFFLLKHIYVHIPMDPEK